LPDGEKHAFLYNPAIDPVEAIDLQVAIGSDPVLDGWVIASATDINDYGVIVGYLEPAGSVSDPNFRRGYVLDTSAWTISLLPDDRWAYSAPRRVNENGDIAGVYRNPDQTWGVYFIPATGTEVLLLGRNVQDNIFLNNPVESSPAQVAGQLSDGTPFRWTTGETPEIISGISSPSVEGINDSGTICGSTLAKRTRYPMRYKTSLEILSGADGWGCSINSAGDLVVNSLVTTRNRLYHNEWGFLNLDDLIDRNDPDAPAWLSRSIYGFELVGLSDRDDTDFGWVSGRLTFAEGGATFFLLTPVPNQ
jgi:hypothetical protein